MKQNLLIKLTRFEERCSSCGIRRRQLENAPFSVSRKMQKNQGGVFFL